MMADRESTVDNRADPLVTLPMVTIPQIVPSAVCLACEVCCRFPERDSVLRPYFTDAEIVRAVAHGMAARHFSNSAGCQVDVIPPASGEGYICPAFDSDTFQCRIYEVRPLDCQIYPFMLMWDRRRQVVQLGWDTKCPFLSDQAASGEKGRSDTVGGKPGPELPEETARFAKVVADRLESEDLLAVVSKHPRLVAEFQEDVVAVKNLERLTRRLLAG